MDNNLFNQINNPAIRDIDENTVQAELRQEAANIEEEFSRIDKAQIVTQDTLMLEFKI